jgi:uncharacterized protein YybS (DUF2232 family)
LLGVAFSIRGHATLLDQTVRSFGAFFAGAFVVLALLRVRSLLTRSLLSAMIAMAGVAGWYFKLQLHFIDFRSAVSTQTWNSYRVIFPELPIELPLGGAEGAGGGSVSEFARNLADGVASASMITPGFLTLVAMVGGWLAWIWYVRISRRPIGPPAKPLHEFRFNDQLIWVLIADVALTLLTPSEALGNLAANLFVVIGGLYAVRGLAITMTGLRRTSPWFALVLYLLAFPVLPFALFAIGVADTWLDLRRRMAPPQGVTR